MALTRESFCHPLEMFAIWASNFLYVQTASSVAEKDIQAQPKIYMNLIQYLAKLAVSFYIKKRKRCRNNTKSTFENFLLETVQLSQKKKRSLKMVYFNSEIFLVNFRAFWVWINWNLCLAKFDVALYSGKKGSKIFNARFVFFGSIRLTVTFLETPTQMSFSMLPCIAQKQPHQTVFFEHISFSIV